MTKTILTRQEGGNDTNKSQTEVLDSKNAGNFATRPLGNTRPSTDISEIVSLGNTKIALLDRVTMVTVLDSCIQELSILKYIVNEPTNESWDKLYNYETLSDRFTFSTPKKKKAFAEQEYENILLTENQKLLRDICFLISTLRESARDILEKGHYHTISNVLQTVRAHHEQSDMIEEKYKMNTKEIKILNNKYRKEKKEFTTAIEQTESYIHELEHEYQDVVRYGKLELRYTDEWEKARQHQQNVESKQVVTDYTQSIDNDSIKIEYENRIHSEVLIYIDENIEDMQNDIGYWMGHYDVEMERLEHQIIKMRMRWETLIEDHKMLVGKYLDRKNFIIERREINERRRREAELLKIQTKAAIKIQAWWRGTMVRRKLGKYKEKKGAKAKKQQNAKKKEKELGKAMLLLKQQKKDKRKR